MIAAPPPPKTCSYKPASYFATIYGAALAQADIEHFKLMCCYFAMLGVSLFWLTTLTKYAQKPGCLPWCLTFITVSFLLAAQLFSEQVRRTRAPAPAKPEPRSLVETLTAAYTLASFAICAAFINTQWFVIDRTVLTQQMIEIELSPLVNATASDNRIPLSKQRQVPKPLNRMVAAARAVAQLPAHPVAPVVTHPAAQAVTHPAAVAHAHPLAQAKPIVAAISMPLRQPSKLSAKTTALPARVVAWPAPRSTAGSGTQQHVPRSGSASSFFMEEMPPAQLVEVQETDNSTPPTLRSTTNSPGSAMNVSMLADYLRELHKIIRAAWTPPRETIRSAEIVFRIKRSGQLALVKVVRSSGDTDSDESAINAITASSPFKPLPAAYSLASLDVDYTFNYTADKLTEVGSRY